MRHSLRHVKLAPNVQLDTIGQRMAGYFGADVVNVCRYVIKRQVIRIAYTHLSKQFLHISHMALFALFDYLNAMLLTSHKLSLAAKVPLFGLI